MRLRSLLFVPGDRPERFAKAAGSGADAIIIDLEDSVVSARKDVAAAAAADHLRQPSNGVKRFVRINPIDGCRLETDLAVARHADGIVLPKAEGAASIAAIVRLLGEGCPPLLPIATETPSAIFTLGEYRDVADRLCGVTWGAEDLPAAVGAATSREPDGGFTAPYELARSLTLFAAAAAGVAPIDTVFPAISDAEGLGRYAARAARDGFTGMLAIHPGQVAIINAAFTPDAEAVTEARAIVAAFEASPEAGAVQLDGKMIDAPHLKQARRVLDRAGG